MDSIKFKKNWNNKLNCDFFTSIRMAGPKYKEGNILNLLLQKGGINQQLGHVRVYSARPLRIHQITEFMARLDSGLSVDELKNELYYMYKETVPDINQAHFFLILFQKVKAKPVQNALFGTDNIIDREF
ncbi:MAG: hypothetical protein AB2L24_21770 [Mangrovibacterium sp.]